MIRVLLQQKYDTFIALLMPIMLLTMTVTHNSIFLYAIIGLCLLHIIKPIVIFPVYFIASLSSAYFAIGEGVSVGRFLSLIMIISLVVDLTIKGVNHKSDWCLPVLLLFAVYCFLSALLSVTGSLIPFILLIQGLIVLLLLPKIKGLNIQYLCSLLFFSCFIALIGVWIQIVSVGFEQLMYERYHGVEGETNSNRIAMMVMQLGLVVVSPFIAHEKNKMIRLSSILGYILSVVIILFTGSRASLIASLGAFIITFIKISHQNIRKYIIPILIITIIAYIIFKQVSHIDSKVFDRFSLESLENSGGSDRWPAIKIFIHYIFPIYPLFGVGLGGENFNVVASHYGMNHPCHNIFFDSLAQLGLFGIFIFMYLSFNIFNKTWRSLNSSPYQFPFIIALILVLGAVINGIGETVYLEKWFWNALSLCLLFIVNKKTGKEWVDINH